jgi:hypothetical protein
MNFKSLKFWLSFSVIVISIFIIGIHSINADTDDNLETTFSPSPKVTNTNLPTDVVSKIPTKTPTETPIETYTEIPTETDDTIIETVTLSNGFSPLQDGGFTVTTGSMVETDFEKEITCLIGAQLKYLLSEEENIFSNEEIEFFKKQEYYNNEKLALLLIRNMFSKVFHDEKKNWLSESINITVSSKSKKQSKFLKSLHFINQNDFTLKGTIIFTGNSIIPKKVYTFISASYITFGDGKKIRIINTDTPYVMDTSGDKSIATVSDDSTIELISNDILEN